MLPSAPAALVLLYQEAAALHTRPLCPTAAAAALLALLHRPALPCIGIPDSLAQAKHWGEGGDTRCFSVRGVVRWMCEVQLGGGSEVRG